MGKLSLKFSREELLSSINYNSDNNSHTARVLEPVGAQVVDEDHQELTSPRRFDNNYSMGGLHQRSYVLIPTTKITSTESYKIDISTKDGSKKDRTTEEIRSIKTTLQASLTYMGISVEYNKGQAYLTIINNTTTEQYSEIFEIYLSFIPTVLTDLITSYAKYSFEVVDHTLPLSIKKQPSPFLSFLSRHSEREEGDDLSELEELTPATQTGKGHYLLRDKVYNSSYMPNYGDLTGFESTTTQDSSTTEEEDDLPELEKLTPATQTGKGHYLLRDKVYSSLYMPNYDDLLKYESELDQYSSTTTSQFKHFTSEEMGQWSYGYYHEE